MHSCILALEPLIVGEKHQKYAQRSTEPWQLDKEVSAVLDSVMVGTRVPSSRWLWRK